MVEMLLRLETQPVFTQNIDYLDDADAKWFARYTIIQRPYHVVDDYKDESRLMARVRAYFQVAYKVGFLIPPP